MASQLVLKVVVTAMVVVAVSEIAKRSSFWGAVLASLPLTSLLAFIWLYVDTGDSQSIASLSRGIFWLVIASLPLFAVLPAMLDRGWLFWPSLFVASSVTVATYFVLVLVLQRLGIHL